MSGSIDTLGEVDTFYVQLAVGDTVDIALWPLGPNGTSLSYPQLRVFDPSGVELASVVGFAFSGDTTRYGYSQIDPGRVIETSGTHRIEVAPGTVYYFGDYSLSVRRSGAVALWSENFADVSIPFGGGLRVDTLWLVNAGARPTSWSLTTGTESWLSVSPTGGTLPAPSPGAPGLVRALQRRAEDSRPVPGGVAPEVAEAGLDRAPGLAPAGAVRIVVTIDPTGLPLGTYETATLALAVDDPWWDLTGDATARLDVFDPRAELIAEDVSDDLWAIEMHPNGQLVLSTTDSLGSSLEFMDPESGARTPWMPNISPFNTVGISGLTFGPDSALWVTDSYGMRPVFRIFPDGSQGGIEYLGGARESTLAPDGSLYFSARTSIQRVDYFGAVTEVWKDLTGPRATGVAYHPLDGKIYFGGVGGTHAISRLDPTNGGVEEIATLGPSVYSISVGASGYLYMAVLGTPASIVVMSPDGDLVEEIRGPIATGAAGSVLTCGAIYATTGNRRQVYRIPVDDCPYDRSATNLVADFAGTVEFPAGWVRSDSLEVTTNDGTPAEVEVATGASWLSVDAPTGTTPFAPEFTIDASALEPGSYVDTVVFTSPDVANSPLLRVVHLEVVEPTLAAGDSLFDSFVDGDEEERYYFLELATGDVVDIGVFDDGGDPAYARLSLEAPNGRIVDATPRTTPTGEVVAGYHAPESGAYRVRVYWGGAPDPGSYELAVRDAGAVVLSDPSALDLWTPEGSGPVTDTLWLYNSGPGSVSWELLGAPAWLSVSPTSGTLDPAAGGEATPMRASEEVSEVTPGLIPPSLTGPAAVTARPPPSGAVPVVVTADPSELIAGDVESTTLEFHTDDDLWAGDYPVSVELQTIDPDVSIVARLPYRVMEVFVYSSTELLVTRNRDLWKVDRATGEATAWIQDLGMDAGSYPSPLLGMAPAGDGAVYVADQSAGAIYRVEADGTTSTAMQIPGATPYDPIVLPDGTLVAVAYQGFYRRNRDGSVSRIKDFEAIKRSVYNPLDGWIYSASLFTGALHRVHPVTGVLESLGEVLPGIPLDLDVGAGGDLYLRTSTGHYVLSPTLEVLEEVTGLAGNGFGIALGGEGENVLYATGAGAPGGNGQIYSYSVEDHRPPVPEGPTAVAIAHDEIGFAGDVVHIPIELDLTATGKALGSVAAEVRWDPEQAQFASLEAVDFEGPFESNSDGEGVVVLAAVSTDEVANVGALVLADLGLIVDAAAGEEVLIDLTIRELVATDFTNLVPGLEVRDGVVRGAEGTWGDPSDDRGITSMDALECLTVVVDGTLPTGVVPNRCDVAPDVDANADGTRETFDGTVTALDALAILRHIVELALPAEYRVGRLR